MQRPKENDVFVITGGGSGIGRALAVELANRGNKVMIVGRRQNTLEETSALSPLITACSADISTAHGRKIVVEALKTYQTIQGLVHNAGVIEPIAPMVDIAESDWVQTIATNLNAPLFLTQLLLSKLNKTPPHPNPLPGGRGNLHANPLPGGRGNLHANPLPGGRGDFHANPLPEGRGDFHANPIPEGRGDFHGQPGRVMHIGSGAAYFPVSAWAPYCVSKAGLSMLTRCWQLELGYEQTAFTSVMPGIIDTDMQAVIRNSAVMHPKKLEFFHRLFNEKKLITADTVAQFLAWLLLKTTPAQYASKEWDIYDKSHHPSWLHAPHHVPYLEQT